MRLCPFDCDHPIPPNSQSLQDTIPLSAFMDLIILDDTYKQVVFVFLCLIYII